MHGAEEARDVRRAVVRGDNVEVGGVVLLAVATGNGDDKLAVAIVSEDGQLRVRFGPVDVRLHDGGVGRIGAAELLDQVGVLDIGRVL